MDIKDNPYFDKWCNGWTPCIWFFAWW
jgi:hypothetical protein